MTTIYYKGANSIQKLKTMGRQREIKKRLEKRDVKFISKEEVINVWNKVREDYGDKEYVSNCCGAKIIEPIQDNTARCPECYEGCVAVKV